MGLGGGGVLRGNWTGTEQRRAAVVCHSDWAVGGHGPGVS